jgi:hypothetical protein
MSDRAPEGSHQHAPAQKRRRWWDIPLLIKLLLLLLLIVLLFAEFFSGEYDERGGWQWLILILKIVLIIVLLFLIWVQRWLKCEITTPTGCVKEELDTTAGAVFVRVKGTASGAVFGSYTVEIRQDGGAAIPGVVSYPGGGASGGVPVVNGELARINTAALSDGAYVVTLTVHPAGFGSAKSCSVTFNLLKVFVVMTQVGKVPVISMSPVPDNPNPFDEMSELHKDFAPGPAFDHQLVSVGGSISIDGSAYVFGCDDRKLKTYEIRQARVTAPGGEHPQPGTLAPIPGTWPVANRFQFLDYVTPDHYLPWTRVGPAPRNLINSWGTITFFGTTYYVLTEGKWASWSVPSGRYSLLLTATDNVPGPTGPFMYHDVQHVWLDNEPVYALITGIQGVAPCADLQLSQFAAAGMIIEGYAWDRLIDDMFPDTAPNDNFDRYELTLVKQGGGTHNIGSFPNRVIAPFRKTGPPPTSGEADALANFDIVSVIDAGSGSSDPAVEIARGTGCAYYLTLNVWDKTRVNDDSGTHHASAIWPFCITNDIRGRPDEPGRPS